jgi:hypothetical protein
VSFNFEQKRCEKQLPHFGNGGADGMTLFAEHVPERRPDMLRLLKSFDLHQLPSRARTTFGSLPTGQTQSREIALSRPAMNTGN